MKKTYLLLTILIAFIQGCKDNNDCNELCFTPPENFQFEIVDKTSGENLFTNGTYNVQDIIVTNVMDNSPVEFTFISENDMNLIQIGSIGFKTEIVNLKVDISGNYIFSFYVDAERKEGCCSYTLYKEISISEAEFELDKQSEVYKILVE